ncbi:MAG TPA: LptF/LptG family permease [Spirochaetota bacterium]|nr:LptF/LptG family permease [Spirochaetota bacterium]HOS32358.1 LptF/LptG family permease [Spirochaetota bacterium]HOS55605.1 LptF/LptG family permease [Spirochaetota bacterium]HQF78157.1 LptF/LptG family permease [Spirochaetota bacterium]HRU44163.1 LptF/LptG family permease [Spirochaetota bacterium]
MKKNVSYSIVTKYILKEFLPTFIVAFLFFFIIFVINHVLYYIKPLFEKNIPLDLIGMMFVTAFPLFTILSLPFGMMLATLMTMGRFSTDNEIVAFRALGFNIMRVFGPIFICGAIVSILSFIVYDWIYPISMSEQRYTIRKISQIKPTIDFKSKKIKKYGEKTLFTDIVKDTSIEGLIIIDGENQDRIITAKEAIISNSETRKGSIELKMNGTMIQFDNVDRPGEFNFGYSDSIFYYIDYLDFEKSASGISSSERRTYEILEQVKKYKGKFAEDRNVKYKEYINIYESTNNIKNNSKNFVNNNKYTEKLYQIDNNIETMIKSDYKKYRDKSLNNHLIDLYNKFALPLACIIFAIFAAPIGIFSRRAGFSIGFVVGVFLCAIYWFAYYGSRILGIKKILTPFIAMFGPNMFFLVVGLFFLIKRLRE